MREKTLSKESQIESSWHLLSIEEVFEKLGASARGLSEEQAQERQKTYGLNTLPLRKPPSLFAVFFNQFLSPLIYILLVAGALSVLIGETVDAIFIFAVIMINAALGTFQEWKAEQSAAALQDLLKTFVRVRRDNTEKSIPADELVPGDIVILESGNKVPADIRLVQEKNISVDESLLTGESIVREKNTSPLPQDISVADRTNLLFAGSTVMAGRGVGVVTGTGLKTELGKIARAVVASEASKPPLLIRMEKFSRQVSYIILAACVVLATIAIYNGLPYAEVFFLAVALAVSAIPEGLPVALTVALSVATKRMVGKNVIVRKLTAVESLGSCTFIASDKTGTLTVNQQTVKLISLPGAESYSVTGEGYSGEGQVVPQTGRDRSVTSDSRLQRLAKASILCNEATLAPKGGEWTYNGDAVDVALLAFGYKMGFVPSELKEKIPVVGDIPFESERRFAAVFLQEENSITAAIKGAVETVVPFCKTMFTSEGLQEIDLAAIEKEANRLANNGYRVIAVADGSTESGQALAQYEEKDLPPLVFLGLVGFIDPLRPEVKDSVATCRQAGIEVAMVTGDHPATALAIAIELGIASSQEDIMTGSELEKLGTAGSPEFVEAIRRTHVFARVTPLQKLYIVEALIKTGHFVAVTGDGANDAPALRRAHIGVAMGSGTDIAKDTASIIITDDKFNSIEAGVEEGRIAYDNIRKVVFLLLSTGLAEVILFVLAILFAVPIPLLAVQLLWLNLVTNGIQDVALAFESGEKDVMKRPPRDPSEEIFNMSMIKQIGVSGLTMGLVGFAAWYWLMEGGWEEAQARNLILLLMVLFENFHAFNCRSEYLSTFSIPLKNNWLLVIAVVTAFGLHLAATNITFMQNVLRVNPVSLRELAVLLVVASSLLGVLEVYKFFRRKSSVKSPLID